MYDFIRIACAVSKVSVADPESNCTAIIEKMRKAAEKGADIAVFPELCVTGYTCQDLFQQSSLINRAVSALKAICAENKALGGIAAVGVPLYICGSLYNCAVVIADGLIRGLIPKTFIPNYNEFYERRWFASSEDLTVKSISSAQLGISDGKNAYDIPIGRDLVFNVNHNLKFAVEICEDLWSPVSPGRFLALGGAELILNLSAGNETIAKRSYRRSLVRGQSASCICAYAYVCAGADESTQDLIFPGHCIIAENGTVLAESENRIFSEALTVTDADLGKIRADRMKNMSFKDCARIYGRHEPCRIVEISASETALNSDGSLYTALRRLPFVPSDEKDRQDRCLGIFDMQVSALKKRLSSTGCKAVVGVSGGLDSTLALLVSAEATRRLDRPLSDVYGITMPCFGTTSRTYRNSLELMRTLGVSSEEINIKSAVEQHFTDIGHDPGVKDLTFENSQARERTQVLMDYAGKVGGLVVGTGDLSELALGWCTYNADQMSMYGVNAGIPKTLIRWMIDSLVKCSIFPESENVLRDVLDTPVSPELLPPDENGNIAQCTESIVGPYELHDFFLYHMLRFGFSQDKLLYLAKTAFKGEYDDESISKWFGVFKRRFVTQQFKRSCMPDGVKVGSVSLSPRGDWRMPSDSRFDF